MLLSYSVGLACSRVTQASGGLPGWLLCKLTPLVTQSWHPCSSSPTALLLFPGQASTHVSPLASSAFLRPGSFSRAPDSSPVTGYKVPKTPRIAPNWPLLCPISLQTFQALISSCFYQGCIHPRSTPSPPFLKSPNTVFQKLPWLLTPPTAQSGCQRQVEEPRVQLKGLGLSQQAERDVSSREPVAGTFSCPVLLGLPHLRTVTPLRNSQANKQA